MTQPTSATAYLRTKVMTATPAELRLMLLDGAIRNADQARDAMGLRNWEAMFNGISRAQQIVMELINGLKPDRNPELCQRLSGLYTYIYTLFMRANTEREVSLLDEALNLLRFERDTWAMLLERLAQENQAAAQMHETPGEQPTIPPASGPAESLIGATLSLRG